VIIGNVNSKQNTPNFGTVYLEGSESNARDTFTPEASDAFIKAWKSEKDELIYTTKDFDISITPAKGDIFNITTTHKNIDDMISQYQLLKTAFEPQTDLNSQTKAPSFLTKLNLRDKKTGEVNITPESFSTGIKKAMELADLKVKEILKIKPEEDIFIA